MAVQGKTATVLSGSANNQIQAKSKAGIEGFSSDGNVAGGEDFISGRVFLTVVGFSCFLALQTYYGLSFALPLSAGYSETVAIALRMVAIVATIAFFLFCYLRANWVLDHYFRFLGIAMSLGLVPFAVEIASSFFGLSVASLAFVTWSLFGVSYAASVLFWCLILSQNSFRQNVAALAGSALLSVFLFVATSSIQPKALSLMGTMSILLCGLVIARTLSKRVRAYDAVLDREEYVSALTVKEGLWIVSHNLVYGFVLIIAASQSLSATLVIGACGVFGALLVLIVRRLPPNKMPSSRQIQQWSLPITVCSLLLVPYSSEVGLVVCAGLNVALSSFSTILSWCETAGLNAEFHLHPIRRFAQIGLPRWFGMLLGTACGYFVFVSAEISDAYLSMLLIAISFLILMSFTIFCVSEERKVDSIDKSIIGGFLIAKEQDSTFVGSCKKVAEEHGLSPRETEVLILLAKGRNADYIQEKLFISLSTARSHIYHIYKKLGISSRQSLIDMVEQQKQKN